MDSFEEDIKEPNSDSLILQELVLRRQEAHAALSSLYLRGTVLLAVAVTELGMVVGLKALPAMAIPLLAFVILASVLGLVSFWPMKSRNFKIEFMESFLKRQGLSAAKSYRAYIQADCKKMEEAVTIRTRYVKSGFSVSFVVLLAIAVLSTGWIE